MPPEGRESILTYSRAKKSWIPANDWVPSLDEFLQGIAASHNGTCNPKQALRE
jgi:hypothetical protein